MPKRKPISPEVVSPGGIPDVLPLECDMSRITPSEYKLLLVLSDPAVRTMPISEICERAQIGRDTYYRAHQKPYFVEISSQLAIMGIKTHMNQLVHAGVRFAEQGSFQHWKTLLEMAGLYDAKKGQFDLEADESGITIRFADPRRLEG